MTRTPKTYFVKSATGTWTVWNARKGEWLAVNGDRIIRAPSLLVAKRDIKKH